MAKRQQFTFYRSFYEAINILPQEIRLELYEALIRYALDKTQPDSLDPVQSSNFILIKPVLDSAWEKAMAGMNSGKARRTKREQNANKKENKKEQEEEQEEEKEIEIESEDECPEGFRAFWELYPVKLGQAKALEVWKRLDPDPEAVCDGVKKWLQTRQWEEDHGRFIPRAVKFLEEQYYEHLPGDHIPVGASGVLGKAELEAIEMVMREK